MTKLGAIFQKNIAEIAADPVLRLYGVMLSLVHVVSYFFLFMANSPRVALGRESLEYPSLCWAAFPDCWRVVIPAKLFVTIGGIYVAFAAASAILFAIRRLPAAYYVLLGLTVFKFGWILLDYRYMGNYHYMPFIVSLAFLFVPGKTLVCRAFILLFYVSAGFLKLNPEWLSGSALFASPGASGILLEWMCASVIFMELICVFGLFAESRWIRWPVLGQLVVFHLYSYRIVGYFYPCVMACLISIFPILWISRPADAAWPFRRLRAVHAAVLGLFILAQLWPHFQKGDPALRGEGRTLALNMFDANTFCVSQLFVKQNNTITEIQPPLDFAVRIRCDPLVVWNAAREHCRRNRHVPGFRDIDVTLSARRSSDPQFTPLMAVQNFCALDPSFHVLWSNEWML